MTVVICRLENIKGFRVSILKPNKFCTVLLFSSIIMVTYDDNIFGSSDVNKKKIWTIFWCFFAL